MRRILFRSLGLLVLASLLMVPAALAQGQQPPQQAPEVDVDEEEIQTVAELYVEIEEIRQSYQPRFQEMEDPQEAQELQQELRAEIDQAIQEEEDMTAERYDEIIRAAQVDEELRNQILAAIEEVRGDGSY